MWMVPNLFRIRKSVQNYYASLAMNVILVPEIPVGRRIHLKDPFHILYSEVFPGILSRVNERSTHPIINVFHYLYATYRLYNVIAVFGRGRLNLNNCESGYERN